MNRKVIAAFALFALPLHLSASSGLDAIAEKILMSNPELISISAQSQATLGKMKLDNNLPPTEITFTHEWGHRGVGNKKGVEVSQGFDWPGAYRARSESQRATASALRLLEQQRRSELTLEVKQQLITLWAASRKKRIYELAVGKIDSLSRIVEREVERREVSILDGNRLKIERISLARKLGEAVDAYHEAFGSLMQLNGGKSPDSLIGGLSTYQPDVKLRPLSEYYALSAASDYGTQYRNQLARASVAEARALRLSSYPGFNIGLTYENEMGDRFTGISLGLTLPFFSNRGRSQAAQLATSAIEAENSVTETAIRARIHTEYVRSEQLQSEIRQYLSVLESANHIQLLDQAFDSRHISLTDYITDLIYFTEATGDYIDLNTRLYLLYTSLERYSIPSS